MNSIVAARSRGSLKAQLDEGLSRLGLVAGISNKLLKYIDIIAKWNQVYNLTAIREPGKMVSAHLLDSLAVASHIRGERLLDVGSGAGLPGIPLAIAEPSRRVILLDSNHKKAAFLRQAVAELQLENAEVVCERAENWRPAGSFDCIVSRALSALAEFVTLTRHLLAPGGMLAAMKGVSPDDEIQELPDDFRVRELLRLSVPGLDAERHLVIVERA